MFEILKGIYFTKRFYLALTAVILSFLISAFLPFLIYASIFILISFCALVFFEIFMLFRRNGLVVERDVAARLSNGDENVIKIHIKNIYDQSIKLKIIDEIPLQFQRRDIEWELDLPALESKVLQYQLRPVKRGTYSFGATNVFCKMYFGLVERRFRFDDEKLVPVYPSYLQMRKYEIAAISNNLMELGIKKVRRIGSSLEFEQIRLCKWR